MKRIIQSICLVLCLSASAKKQPNIVVMLSDDMGWGQVGCQGGIMIPTPNIDCIAGEGVSLTQFSGIFLGSIDRPIIVTLHWINVSNS